MWMNRAINQLDQPEPLHFATVTQAAGGTINTISHIQTLNTPVVSPAGITSMPQAGQEVFVVPTISGDYVCLGITAADSTILEGELKLFSTGGAIIHLKSNGDIVLNGLIITKDGVIISPAAGGELQ